MSKIISGFPGVGKTFLHSYSDELIVTDSDSSNYTKCSEFPENYMQHIRENLGKADIICVSTHEELRKALVNEDIHFTLIYPHKSLKEEYIKRYKNRGDSKNFQDLISENWDNWIEQLKNQENCTHIELQSNEYIKDKIEQII